MKKTYLTGTNIWTKFLPVIVIPNVATAETQFFLVYGREPESTSTSTIRTHAMFLGDPDSGMLNLEMHRLALAIAKKTLDENWFKVAQKTMDHTPPSFKIGEGFTSRTNSPANGTLNGGQGIELSTLSMMDISYTLKTKPPEKYNPVMWRTSSWNHP